MVARVLRESRMASTAAPQVSTHQGQVAGFDGDVGAGAHGDAQIVLDQGGRVVDTVADHCHDPPLDCRSRTTATLPSGSTSARTASMPTASATACAARALSPVRRIGVRPTERSCATASPLLGLI